MKAGFHPLASRELIDAAQFYEARARRLGSRFLDEVERVVAVLQQYPEIGRPASTDARAFPVRRFPYSLVYRVDENVLQVLAVAHHKRRPHYWTERTR